MSRVVKLTDDQHDRLWRDRRASDLVHEIVGKAIIQATEELAEKEQLFWEAVHAFAKCDPKTEKVTVDWISRELRVKPIDRHSEVVYTPPSTQE